MSPQRPRDRNRFAAVGGRATTRCASKTAALALALFVGLVQAGPAAAFQAPSEYPPAFTPWALTIRGLVLRTLAAHPYGKAASVEVAFKVHRDGTVSDVSVTGEPKAAAHVTAGMHHIDHVPPFPADVVDDVVPLQVKVSFVDPPRRKARTHR